MSSKIGSISPFSAVTRQEIFKDPKSVMTDLSACTIGQFSMACAHEIYLLQEFGTFPWGFGVVSRSTLLNIDFGCSNWIQLISHDITGRAQRKHIDMWQYVWQTCSTCEPTVQQFFVFFGVSEAFYKYVTSMCLNHNSNPKSPQYLDLTSFSLKKIHGIFLPSSNCPWLALNEVPWVCATWATASPRNSSDPSWARPLRRSGRRKQQKKTGNEKMGGEMVQLVETK